MLLVVSLCKCSADTRGHLPLDPTSPRSVTAFLRHGLEPEELRMLAAQDYASLGQPELAELAYRFQEAVRQASCCYYLSSAQSQAKALML